MAFARLAERIAQHHVTQLVVGWTTDRSLVPHDALAVRMSGPYMTLGLWRAAMQAGRALRPDLVVASGLLPPLVPWPTVAVVRDLVGSGWGGPGHVGRASRVRLKQLRAVVVPSQGVRAGVRSLGVDPFRIHRLPEGQDVPLAPSPLPPLGAVLQVLHPGSIHPAKQQHLSIDAVSRLPPALKGRVALVVAGAVRDPRYLEQLRVAARGQPVTVLPDVPDLEQPLRASHVVVYPSALDEGSPDVAVAAMALGRPVVPSSAPGVLEALRGGIGGRTADDVVGLRDHLEDALGGEFDLTEAGRVAHAHVLGRHDWRFVWPRWRALIAALTRR